MAIKTIEINYNNGTGYDTLYPMTSPSLIGAVTTSEVNTIVNNKASEINTSVDSKIDTALEENNGWTHFLDRTVTMTEYNASSSNYINAVFPTNSVTGGEDVLVVANGSITIQGSMTNTNSRLVAMFVVLFGTGYTTSGALFGRRLAQYSYIDTGSNVTINATITITNVYLTWIYANNFVGQNNFLKTNQTTNGWLLLGYPAFSGMGDGTYEVEYVNGADFNMQFVNYQGMSVTPTALNITLSMYKRSSIFKIGDVS